MKPSPRKSAADQPKAVEPRKVYRLAVPGRDERLEGFGPSRVKVLNEERARAGYAGRWEEAAKGSYDENSVVYRPGAKTDEEIAQLRAGVRQKDEDYLSKWLAKRQAGKAAETVAKSGTKAARTNDGGVKKAKGDKPAKEKKAGKPAAPEQKPDGGDGAKSNRGGAPRQSWEGRSMCAVLRWCGGQGLDKEQTLAFAKKLGLDPDPKTVGVRLKDGREGVGVPRFSEEELAKVDPILQKVRGAGVNKSANKKGEAKEAKADKPAKRAKGGKAASSTKSGGGKKAKKAAKPADAAPASEPEDGPSEADLEKMRAEGAE